SLIKEDGTADATYTYTDFGETRIQGDNTAGNEVCYTGGVYDSTTGLYYLNARYYNPEDGRFLTEDTYRGESTEPDTQNLYAYCAGNPVNYVDPSGHKFFGYWSSTQHYYAFNQNAPQQYAGYNDLYDMMSWSVGDLMTQKIETDFFRLQFWKGEYGPPYIPKAANGCEIGLYYRTNKKSFHWFCAAQSGKRLRMKMSLEVNGKKLFSRDSKTSTKQGKAWWLTAFKPRNYMPKKKLSKKGALRMKGDIWFPNKGTYKKKFETLSKKLKLNKRLNVKGGVNHRTFSWK
ncbi:MAG: DUF4474 domain-containing protein, partial [Anaerostipes sp.]|nr:DUF4474 domain-containing protein [Anaerostipes sp.]